MLLLVMRSLLFPVVVPVEKRIVPAVAPVPEPLMLQFWTVSLLASPMKRMVVAVEAVFVLSIVRSRLVPPTVFEPSIMTQFAPFRLIRAVAFEPLIVGVMPLAGLIVTVLIAL